MSGISVFVMSKGGEKILLEAEKNGLNRLVFFWQWCPEAVGLTYQLAGVTKTVVLRGKVCKMYYRK